MVIMYIARVDQAVFLTNIVTLSVAGLIRPRGPPGLRGPPGAPGPVVPPAVVPPPTSAPDGGNNVVNGEEESARTFFPESWIWAVQKAE